MLEAKFGGGEYGGAGVTGGWGHGCGGRSVGLEEKIWRSRHSAKGEEMAYTGVVDIALCELLGFVFTHDCRIDS